MALITTPGAANTDAFVGVEYVDAYAEARGHTAWSGSNDVPAKERAIRRATTVLSTGFGWKGRRTNGRAQAQAWPRISVVDGEGEAVPSDAYPAEIEQACAEMSLREFDAPGSLTPDVDQLARVKREKVEGIEVEYAAAPASANAARPILTIVGDLVAGLLAGVGGGGGMFGKTVRA